MKKKLWFARLFGIGMFLAVFSLNLFSQGADDAVFWKRIGPWGGDVRDIKMKIMDSATKALRFSNGQGDRDSVVVAVYGSGVFMNDSAASQAWISRNVGLPSRKVMSLGIRKSGTGDTMYVGLDAGGVWRTYSGGQKWEPAYGSGIASIATRSVYAIAVHPNKSWEVYAATDQGLWKTVNCGASWHQIPNADIPTNQICSDVQLHEYSTGKVYASSGTRVYRSIDNGNDGTWASITLNGNSAYVNALALAFVAEDTVFAGTNDGKVYEITFPPPTYTLSVRTVFNNPSYPIFSLAINPSIDTSGNYIHVVGAADTLFLGTKYGFFKGVKNFDKNYGWLLNNSGLGNTMVAAVCYYPGKVIDSLHSQQQYVFAGTGFNGFYSKHTYSTTWSVKNDSLPFGGLKVVAASPLASDIVFAGGGYALGSGLANGCVWKTTNAMSAALPPMPTWTRIFPIDDTATSGKLITSIGCSYYAAKVLWVADSLTGIYKTSDGGSTWTQVYNGVGVSYVYVPRYIDKQPTQDTEVVYAARRINGVWKVLTSNKGGTSFTTTSTTSFYYPITSIIIDSTSDKYMYVTTWGGGVWKSTDNGNNFTNITFASGAGSQNVYSLAVDSNYNHLVIGTDMGIFKSADRGKTWLDDNNGAAGYAIDHVTNVFSTRDTVWAALSGRGIFYRTKSSLVTSWTRSYLDFGATGYASPIPYDTLKMRDLDFVWKWTYGYGLPIDGYSVSEIHAVFRRNNSTVVAGDHPIVNGTTQASDSVYVYIPDTISGFRNGAVVVPIRIVNAARVDSFRVTINFPTDYGTYDTIITHGTLTAGQEGSFAKSAQNPLDLSQRRFVFNGGTLGTNADTVLFKVRYTLSAAAGLNDSLPQANIGDSSIHIVRGMARDGIGSLCAPEDSTDFMWYNSTDSNATAWGAVNRSAISRETTDTVGIFWLTHLPENDPNNNLPGILHSEVTSTTNWKGTRGQFETYYSAAYNSAAEINNANVISDHDWYYTRNTGSQMLVRINPSAAPKYPYLTCDSLLEGPIRTGDAIGAFYYRNDTLVCGGYGLWRVDTGATFTVYGDDAKSPLKDGFVTNEQLIFKIYDSRYKKVWSVPTSFTDGPMTFVEGQIKEMNNKFDGKVLRDMYIAGAGPDVATGGYIGGWHLVSSYLVPVEPDVTVSELFKYVDNFILMKDENANLYWPYQGINSIQNWDYNKAYWVYYSANATNTRNGYANNGTFIKLFRGVTVPKNSSITFGTNGWYFIPYWGNKDYQIASALASIAGKFKLVMNDSGRVYWPSAGQDQIGNMEPGQGYAIYVDNAPATLTYPSAIMYASMRSIGETIGIPGLAKSSSDERHFKFNRVSPNSQVIGVKVEGMTLREGDEVGIFTNDGTCVGTAAYKKNNKNTVAVTVFGNDELSSKEVKNGAFDGEELVVKVYVKTDQKEYTPKVQSISWALGEAKGLVFKTGTIANVSLSMTGKILPTEYALDQNFPNPFNPTTTIRYALPEDGLVKIKIYDLLGREVRELVNTNQLAGYYSVEWDGMNNNGKQVATGFYLYKIEANKFSKSLKMMFMK